MHAYVGFCSVCIRDKRSESMQFGLKKTRIPELPVGTNCTILGSLVLSQYQRWQTGRNDTYAYTGLWHRRQWQKTINLYHHFLQAFIQSIHPRIRTKSCRFTLPKGPLTLHWHMHFIINHSHVLLPAQSSIATIASDAHCNAASVWRTLILCEDCMQCVNH